jgi:hypothetical protein
MAYSDLLCLGSKTSVYFESTDESCDDCVNLGFSHMAAALMAMEHFNTRNSTVVPEISELGDCPIQFDMNNSAVFNTDTYTHLGVQTLAAQLSSGLPPPCAVVGPYNDIPGVDLSAMAAAFKFPVTMHRGFNLRLLTDIASPYTTQLYPDIVTTMAIVITILLLKGRTDYIAFVYPLTETGTLWREAFSIVLDEETIESRSYSYNSFFSPATSDLRSMQNTMEAVKASGYRTILVAPDLPSVQIPAMAQVATELGLTNGDYLWIFAGDFDLALLHSSDAAVQELLRGSLLIAPISGRDISPVEDPFYRAWRSQGPDQVKILNAANPIQVQDGIVNENSTGKGFVKGDSSGYMLAEDDFFQQTSPVFGSSFLYDAVIATGMGACQAFAASNGSGVEVEPFVEGIRSVTFTGATGYVQVGCDDCTFKSGRYPYTTMWRILNLLPPVFPPPEEPILAIATELILGNYSDLYVETVFLNETYYADGRTVPPDLLRDPPEQNYLSTAVRGVGLAVMALALLLSAATTLWVYIHREHRVVKAAQPYFLYLICLSAGVSVSAVLPLSFDEGKGWSAEQIGSACMAVPWLFCLGYLITYGALFSKLWRIHRVLQMRRQAIMIKQVVWPSLALFVAALLILGLWTGLDPIQWVREETNSVTGESIGQCQSNDMVAYVIPLIFVMLIPTLLTAYMAWRTKDVDEEYSESHWIFIMVFVQCEVILFAVPTIALLRDVSTEGRYIGFVLLMWTFPMSTLLLIVGPKYLAFRRARAESSGGRRKQTTRGHSHRGVHVSGLIASGDTANLQPTPPDSQASHAEEEPRYPANGHDFAEQIGHFKPAADLSAIKE